MAKDDNTFVLHNYKSDGKQIGTFYKLNEDGEAEEGTTVEEMLRVAKERLVFLNSQFPCEENERAIRKIDKAIEWLDARTKDREERGVEGKHEA